MVQNIQQKLPGESPLRQPAVVLSREPWTQQNVPIGKAFKKEQIRVGRDHCQTRVLQTSSTNVYKLRQEARVPCEAQ